MPDPGWYAWGYNYSGSLGCGLPGGATTSSNRLHTPTPMAFPPGVVPTDVKAGYQSGMGILEGNLYGWGDNTHGGVGLPNGGSSTANWIATPTVVPSISGVAQFGVGDSWAGALKNDGTLWFCGRNDQGHFGNGTFSPTASNFGFAQTTGGLPSTIAKLIVHDNVCSLIDGAGHLWMAGSTSGHRIPDNITSGIARYITFTQMTNITAQVVDVALGGDAGMGLYADGTVWMWGNLYHGQAGDGSNFTTNHFAYVPQQVPGLTGITAIAASNQTFFAMKADGTLYAWGWQSQQEAGYTDPTHADRGAPVTVPTVYPMPPGGAVRFIGHLTPYNYTTLVCGTDYLMYGSGYNDGAGAGMVCRQAEQLPGTSTWDTIPAPSHGYPEFDEMRLQSVSNAGSNTTFALFVGAPVRDPLGLIIDMADTPTHLYLVKQGGSAWDFTADTRRQLSTDFDGRQMAAGMLAVATAGEAAFFWDWNADLWVTGLAYVTNAAGENLQINLTYLVKIASKVTHLGPTGLGPSHLNETALWIQGKRQLIGLGDHLHGNILNGLAPSQPTPLDIPTLGAVSAPLSPYHFKISNEWLALALSNTGTYALVGTPPRGGGQIYGQAVG